MSGLIPFASFGKFFNFLRFTFASLKRSLKSLGLTTPEATVHMAMSPLNGYVVSLLDFSACLLVCDWLYAYTSGY